MVRGSFQIWSRAIWPRSRSANDRIDDSSSKTIKINRFRCHRSVLVLKPTLSPCLTIE